MTSVGCSTAREEAATEGHREGERAEEGDEHEVEDGSCVPFIHINII